MILRILTAAVALAVVVPILFLGGVPGAQFLCVSAACLGLWEYGGLRTPAATTANRVTTMILAALPILAAGVVFVPDVPQAMGLGSILQDAAPHSFGPGPWPIRVIDGGRTAADLVLLALGIGFLAIPIQAVLHPHEIETTPSRIAASLFGVFYLGFMLAFCVMLRALPNGLLWICFGLAVVWLGDTGAYVGGRAFGKHKLHPRVSPGKTWEGAALGLATSIAAGFAGRAVFDALGFWDGPRLSATHVLLVSIFAGGMGQVGDLAESLLKRAAGMKDSGTLFPGHGGMLDRIDALLFALPAVYFYAKFVFGKAF